MKFHNIIKSSPRYGKLDILRKHQEEGDNSTSKLLLIGDSLMFNLSMFRNVWDEYFLPCNALNFGVKGDKVENVMWRAENYNFPPSISDIFVLIGTNNLDKICCKSLKSTLKKVQTTVSLLVSPIYLF